MSGRTCGPAQRHARVAPICIGHVRHAHRHVTAGRLRSYELFSSCVARCGRAGRRPHVLAFALGALYQEPEAKHQWCRLVTAR
mgnify:CR=1 FL=1